MRTPFKTYLESRLLTLYPESAYVGMVDESIAEGETHRIAYEAYATANNIVEEAEAVLRTTIPTLADEIEAIGMTTEEIDMWNDLEQYATATKLVSRTQLDALTAQYKSGQKNWQNIIFMMPIYNIFYSGYVVFRILQAANRAKAITAIHFAGNAGGGTRGDAFRHIYWHMHMRRYVGSWVAQFAGIIWEVFNPNDCHDREMDYHNNRVGYRTQYVTFRNGTSSHDWGEWARRVRVFVNNPVNEAFQNNWNWNTTTNPLNCTTVNNDVANTATNRYIFYQQ